jgi:hypothetical protein
LGAADEAVPATIRDVSELGDIDVISEPGWSCS